MAQTTFQEAWTAHGDDLHRYLLAVTRDADLAADLSQTTAERAMRGLARVGEAEGVRPWLFRVATNAWLDELRRRRREAPLDGEERATAGADIAARVDAADLLAEVTAFIAMLPPKQRAALVMRKQHDAGYAEIAAALGCSEAAARRSVHEGLRKVRDRFAGRLAEVAE